MYSEVYLYLLVHRYQYQEHIWNSVRSFAFRIPRNPDPHQKLGNALGNGWSLFQFCGSIFNDSGSGSRLLNKSGFRCHKISFKNCRFKSKNYSYKGLMQMFRIVSNKLSRQLFARVPVCVALDEDGELWSSSSTTYIYSQSSSTSKLQKTSSTSKIHFLYFFLFFGLFFCLPGSGFPIRIQTKDLTESGFIADPDVYWQHFLFYRAVSQVLTLVSIRREINLKNSSFIELN